MNTGHWCERGLRIGHADIQPAAMMMTGCFHHPFRRQLHLSWQQLQVSDDLHLYFVGINDVLMLQKSKRPIIYMYTSRQASAGLG